MAGNVTALGTVTGLIIMQEFLKVNHRFPNDIMNINNTQIKIVGFPNVVLPM